MVKKFQCNKNMYTQWCLFLLSTLLLNFKMYFEVRQQLTDNIYIHILLTDHVSQKPWSCCLWYNNRRSLPLRIQCYGSLRITGVFIQKSTGVLNRSYDLQSNSYWMCILQNFTIGGYEQESIAGWKLHFVPTKQKYSNLED